MRIVEIKKKIENLKPARSKWERAVQSDAVELLENVINDDYKPKEVTSFAELKKLMLRGAENWNRYCTGGFGLISNEEIAEHYATKSEVRRDKCGELKNPNSREDWMKLQARALFQAEHLIECAYMELE